MTASDCCHLFQPLFCENVVFENVLRKKGAAEPKQEKYKFARNRDYQKSEHIVSQPGKSILTLEYRLNREPNQGC